MTDQTVEEEPPEVPLAPYPAPPPFWRAFTTHNLARLKELEHDSESASTDKLDDLPYSLTLLHPPPHPTQDTPSYKLFNVTHLLPPQPTLPPTAEERLLDFSTLATPTTASSARPHARLLWQLTKSLSLNFLEFFTVMADNPVDWEEKWTDVGILLQNIHAVINVLRPHQAREQVKSMLLSRLEMAREEMDRCDSVKTEVERFLESVEREGKAETGEKREAENGVVNGANGALHEQADGGAQKRLEVEKARREWELLAHLDGD